MISVGIESDSLDELSRLLDTLGVDAVARVQMSERSVNPATYIGKGKLLEVKQQVDDLKADVVALDVELSPNQLRNLEKALGKPVLDRSGVIIEIFSQHARSKESKTQVAIARLQYLMPRLTGMWTHFERQRGGGVGQRGMGEKQIEVDRRLIKDRLAVLKKRLKDVENERAIQRAHRTEVFKVALVGYTNAGKSTLLNALTHSKVLAEDKLFATLDPSVRMLDPDCRPPIVLIDTVGFISRLPHALVASFRSTLEELHEADLLLHVVDGSSNHAREQYEVTEKVLEELGVKDKPQIPILNKIDLIDQPAARNRARIVAPGAMAVSALKEKDIEKVRQAILSYFQSKMLQMDLMIPYAQSKLEAQMHAVAQVETKKHLEKGTFYRIRIPEGLAKKLNLARFKT